MYYTAIKKTDFHIDTLHLGGGKVLQRSLSADFFFLDYNIVRNNNLMLLRASQGHVVYALHETTIKRVA